MISLTETETCARPESSATGEERIVAVRTFNRLWTKAIGVLDAGVLSSPYSLTEARVLFELAQDEAVEVADLRRALEIDAGYLSRILGRFRTDGLIETTHSGADGRRQVAHLTARGRAAFEELDSRSADQVAAMLSQLGDEDQRRLVGSMNAILRTLDLVPRREPYLLRPPGPGDLGWIVHRHGVLYSSRYGFDETFEALAARIVADYLERRDTEREQGWIAEIDGEPVGSVFCMKKSETVAQLRMLLVEPKARGLGIGTRLVDECIRFARRKGYRQLTLWTVDLLHEARRTYERAGFELIEEERQTSFGRDLLAQTWSLELARG